MILFVFFFVFFEDNIHSLDNLHVTMFFAVNNNLVLRALHAIQMIV